MECTCSIKKEPGFSEDWTPGLNGEIKNKTTEFVEVSYVKNELFDVKEEITEQDNLIKRDPAAGRVDKKWIKEEPLDCGHSTSSSDCILENKTKSWDSQLAKTDFPDEASEESEKADSSGDEREPELQFEPYVSDNTPKVKTNCDSDKTTRKRPKHKFKCPRCSVISRDKVSFEKHLNTLHVRRKRKPRPPLKYRSAKQIVCLYCDYITHWKSNLKRHLKIHTEKDLKPFSCKMCDYKASENASIKKHMVIHSKARPFKCEHCDYTAKRSSHLTSHVKSVHRRK